MDGLVSAAELRSGAASAELLELLAESGVEAAAAAAQPGGLDATAVLRTLHAAWGALPDAEAKYARLLCAPSAAGAVRHPVVVSAHPLEQRRVRGHGQPVLDDELEGHHREHEGEQEVEPGRKGSQKSSKE